MRYLIRNGVIADGTGKKCFAGSVLIKDSKIEAVFPGKDNAHAAAAAQNAAVVDAQGGYITPGFVDIHRHGGAVPFGGANGRRNALRRMGQL